MEHTHHAVALPANDRILAALLDQGSLPEVAQRLKMSLAALATWTRENARLLADLKRLLKERCKLLTLQHAASAVTALAGVSRSTTTTDDAKLRERALERQRKSATTLLRHMACLQRTPSASSGPHAPANARTAAGSHPTQAVANESGSAHAVPSLDVLPTPSSARPRSQSKPSLAERFAQRRLAMMAST